MPGAPAGHAKLATWIFFQRAPCLPSGPSSSVSSLLVSVDAVTGAILRPIEAIPGPIQRFGEPGRASRGLSGGFLGSAAGPEGIEATRDQSLPGGGPLTVGQSWERIWLLTVMDENNPDGGLDWARL